MKKTTVFINEELIKEAISIAGVRSKKEAIEAGLRSLIKHHNREALRKELGTFELDLDSKELDRLRHAE